MRMGVPVTPPMNRFGVKIWPSFVRIALRADTRMSRSMIRQQAGSENPRAAIYSIDATVRYLSLNPSRAAPPGVETRKSLARCPSSTSLRSAYRYKHFANPAYLGLSAVQTKRAAAAALLNVMNWTKASGVL